MLCRSHQGCSPVHRDLRSEGSLYAAYRGHRELISRQYLVSLSIALITLIFGCEDDASNSQTRAADQSAADQRMLRFDQDPDTDGSPRGDMHGAGDLASPDIALWDRSLPQRPDAGPPPPMSCLDLPEREVATYSREARCRNGGEALKIRHLRDPRCTETFVEGPPRQPGEPVSLEEVVVTGIFEENFTVRDLDGGAYSALWVYNRQRVDISRLQPGTRLRLSGQLIEFFTLTELVLVRDRLEILGEGPAPEPVYVDDPRLIADGGELVEILESQMIELRSLRVSNTVPDCPRDFGMIVVDDSLRLSLPDENDFVFGRDDVIERAFGALHFSFEHQKILIPMARALEVVDCGGDPDKCEASECSVEEDAEESGALIISEIQNNPLGVDETREFVELYNPQPNPLSVEGWRLQDCAGNSAPLSGEIGPRGHLVLASSLNRGENGGVEAALLLGELFLPNGYGSLLIFDQNEQLVDQVRYAPGGEESDWPDRAPGDSLELQEPAADNRVGAAWVGATRSYGDGGNGSPGRAWRD